MSERRRPQYVTELPEPPPREEGGHKGTFGKVLILAGSRGMSGAACLAGLGALRGGAGLVYLGVPAGIVPIVAGMEPSYLTIPLPEDADGRLGLLAQDQLESKLSSYDAVAIGPGWGQSSELTAFCRWLLKSAELPVVVDADGLNALAQILEVLKEGPVPRILTPHPGEFARLINQSVSDVQSRREELAVRFADTHDVVLVLKGHRTVVTDGSRIYINPTGNSGMATGGTGDVLTGLVTALLGQKMQPFDAAQLGVYLHGLAGDLAAEDLSKPGLISSDLPHYLARAWKAFET